MRLKVCLLLVLLWGCKPAEQSAAQHIHTQASHSASQPQPSRVKPDKTPARGASAQRVAVQISPEKQQMIGVRTDLVKPRVLSQRLRAVGKVTYNEQGVSHIHTKVEGWIEKLHISSTGQYVRRGQPLLEIYSPDLLAAQREYLLARQAARQFEDSELLASSRETSAGLVEAARQKLSLWDFTPAQIARLEKTGTVQKNLPLVSPTSGYVIEKKALAGMQVMPGMELYTLADLSTIWVHAQIYEYEAPRIRVGQRATVRLTYLPGAVYAGRVAYIYPYLDPQSRTVTVRLVFPNPAGQLKPEMYADVDIETGNGRQQLTIPVDAVLDSGERKLVFLAHPGGYFEPREITVGEKSGDFYEVLQGLKANQKVVVGANFLIDSESQLKAAVSNMGKGHSQH